MITMCIYICVCVCSHVWTRFLGIPSCSEPDAFEVGTFWSSWLRFPSHEDPPKKKTPIGGLSGK